MKNYLVIIGLFFTVPLLAQSAVEKVLASVENPDDAQTFATHHPQLKPKIFVLNAEKHDTASLYRQLYKKKKGEVIIIGDYSYKIVDDTTEYTFRASYIYFDGSSLSRFAIDSTRSLILERYKGGTSFETLADQYNMDHNPDHGALQPFKTGVMVKEFETAVRQHANGDVFTVDVPDHAWYYVVKKTASDQADRTITILSILTPH